MRNINLAFISFGLLVAQSSLAIASDKKLSLSNTYQNFKRSFQKEFDSMKEDIQETADKQNLTKESDFNLPSRRFHKHITAPMVSYSAAIGAGSATTMVGYNGAAKAFSAMTPIGNMPAVAAISNLAFIRGATLAFAIQTITFALTLKYTADAVCRNFRDSKIEYHLETGLLQPNSPIVVAHRARFKQAQAAFNDVGF